MKRGLTFALFFSVVLILTISFVSASFLGDILKFVFGGTGNVVGGGDICIDSDGTGSYLSAGYVQQNGKYYNDFCYGETVAYDFYCEGTTGGGTFILPFLKGSLTGNVIEEGGGDEPPPTCLPGDPDCETDAPPTVFVYCTDYPTSNSNRVCIGAGVCGCDQGQTYICPGSSTGECDPGHHVCNADGSLSETCEGFIGPTTEICDQKDNDCDGSIDEGGVCEPGGCLDNDHDGYGNPGSSICQNGPQTDCNDNNNTIHPGASEICDDPENLDEDCDGHPNCDDNSCLSHPSCSHEPPPTPENCVDGDGDGAYDDTDECSSGTDCDDDNGNIKPGVDEICDGLDNDCVGGIDDNIGKEIIECQGTSTCSDNEASCVSGAFQTCASLGLTAPTDSETPDDGIDNNCDDSVDEGSDCTGGETKDCILDNACKIGQQSCLSGVWGSCEEAGDVPDCDEETTCTPGKIESCGTNLGICVPGVKKCQSNGDWGNCEDAITPEQEVCGNDLDDDCDGFTDEGDCDTESPSPEGISNLEEDTYSSKPEGEEETGKATEEGKGLFSWLWRIILAIFNFGGVLSGGAISETPQFFCSDSDNGVDYFQKGTGNGLNSENVEVWFVDACYKGTSQVEKCAGESCFLREYWCDDQYFSYDPQVTCKFGCVNGACVPDSSFNENCEYFDKDQWKWINKC